MDIVLERTIEKELIQWVEKKRKKPIIIRGARQVGKSTVVRNFAAKNNFNLVEINLERHPYLEKVFKTLDITSIIQEISIVTGMKIASLPRPLLFLDEIQATPHALQALRYFFEEIPNIPIISAGSLLEFVLADHTFSMPVGRVDYFYLSPMTFKEFLLALGDTILIEAIENFQIGSIFPQSAHIKLVRRQREFLMVGGMPEAVSYFVATQEFSEVKNCQESILATYQDDFSKYSAKSSHARLRQIFHQAPMRIGKKVKYVHYSKVEKSREIKKALELLIMTNVILPVCHSDCNGLPLAAEADYETRKLLFLDVGLMNRSMGLDWQDIISTDDQLLINEGPLAEQFVGQELFAQKMREKPFCHYWLREKKAINAEVDYVISLGKKIIPIEVKSGKSGQLRSLHQFIFEKDSRVAIRFDLNMPSIQEINYNIKKGSHISEINYRLLSLPLYFTSQLERLVKELGF